jgi:hypothetical protein
MKVVDLCLPAGYQLKPGHGLGVELEVAKTRLHVYNEFD